MEYMVKGSSIESKFGFVRERFGAQEERGLRQQFTTEYGLGPLLESSWYDFEMYDTLNRWIADKFFHGSLSRLQEVGRYSAERALTTTYKPFSEAKDLDGLLRRLVKLHNMYYSKGTLEVASTDERSAILRLNGVTRFSEADLHISAGFYAAAVRFVGITDVRATVRTESDQAVVTLNW